MALQQRNVHIISCWCNKVHYIRFLTPKITITANQLFKMSKKVREFRGASIELISPVAQVVYFPGVAELFTIIERIVVLIDTARYNREALLYMKVYMTEVKQTIRDNSETINEEYTPSLMKALKNWEKFLVQYTKPKMRKLLTILNADKVNINVF